ncbi:MAG: glycoside hydrolase, partial [Thermoplasmata archaeon]|nr:glycoside hydrolase [Thermoplasmata archaeon]
MRRLHGGFLAAWTILALVILLVTPVLPLAGSAGTARPPTGGGAPTTAHGMAQAAASSRPFAANLAGPGGFYSTTALPLAPVANRTCAIGGPPGSCPTGNSLNVTNDLALNYTDQGVLVAAYTSLSNEASCPSAVPYVQSVVGLVVSRTNGTAWSTPEYLSNPDCSTAGTYPSAWAPALTSLANGTIVLAYVQYNSSVPIPNLDPYAPPVSRLVLTESYDNGVHWSRPQVLNVSTAPTLTGISFPQLAPSIAAIGQTIYLSWMTMPVYTFGYGNTEGQVALLVSTNGGRYWSPVIPLASSPYTSAANPAVLVAPNGTAFVALAEGFPYSASVYLEVSSDNFTSWTTRTVASGLRPIPLSGPFFAPAPRLALAAGAHRLTLAFIEGTTGSHHQTLARPTLFTSTTDGLRWGQPGALQRLFYAPLNAPPADPALGPYGAEGVYDIEIAVTSSGVLEVEGLFRNASLCVAGSCGYLIEEAANSTDAGVSFSG